MSSVLTDSSLIEVWNNHDSSIGYTAEKGSRVWRVTGEVKKVRLDELYAANNTPGGKIFFEQGALLIRDNEARKLLDLPELDEYVLDSKEMQELIKSSDLQKIEEFLQYCSNMLLQTFVKIAIELPVTNLNIARLITQYSGTDVLMVIEEKATDKSGKDGEANKVIDQSGRAKRIVKE